MTKLFLVSSFLILHSSLSFAQPSLLGTTVGGGPSGNGVLFSIDTAKAAAYNRVHDFSGVSGDGASPYGSLFIANNGNLYGMTYNGGAKNVGEIFSVVAAKAQYKVIYSFNDTLGAKPYGSLMQAYNGMLYGMTSAGGKYGYGVIFSINPATNTYTRIVDFNDTLGSDPYGNLIQAKDSMLYGMTSAGGKYKGGVLFKLNIKTTLFSVTHHFDSATGMRPYGSLNQASNGLLYGMTNLGGAKDSGVIFRYNTATSAYSDIHDFNKKKGAGGYYPYGNFIQTTDGLLYGMTSTGGDSGYGSLFSIDTSSVPLVKELYDFHGITGGTPLGSLLEVSPGILYGTLASGGISGSGAVFRYNIATNSFDDVHDFNGSAGATPQFCQLIKVCLPPAIISQPSGVSLCAGNDTSFTVVASTGTITYKWEANKGSGFYPVTDTGVFSGSTTVTLKLTKAPISINGYTFRCLLVNACGDSSVTDTVTIRVKSNVLPVVSIMGNKAGNTICLGKTDTLTVKVSGSVAKPFSYNWSDASVKKYDLVSPIVNTRYGVVVTDTNGCTSRDTVTVKVIAALIVTITGRDSILSGKTDTLVAYGATSYIWNTGSTRDSLYVSPISITTYTVTGKKGVCTTSAKFTVRIIGVGIEEIGGKSEEVKVFPNPGNGVFTIQSSGISRQASVEVYNVLGEKVCSRFVIRNSQFVIDIRGLAPGMYFLHLNTNTYNTVVKVVKE